MHEESKEHEEAVRERHRQKEIRRGREERAKRARERGEARRKRQTDSKRAQVELEKQLAGSAKAPVKTDIELDQDEALGIE